MKLNFHILIRCLLHFETALHKQIKADKIDVKISRLLVSANITKTTDKPQNIFFSLGVEFST